MGRGVSFYWQRLFMWCRIAFSLPFFLFTLDRGSAYRRHHKSDSASFGCTYLRQQLIHSMTTYPATPIGGIKTA